MEEVESVDMETEESPKSTKSLAYWSCWGVTTVVMILMGWAGMNLTAQMRRTFEQMGLEEHPMPTELLLAAGSPAWGLGFVLSLVTAIVMVRAKKENTKWAALVFQWMVFGTLAFFAALSLVIPFPLIDHLGG